MSLLLLDMLPMELLQLIGNMLHDDHKPSIASFSLVNRQCRRAASPALFRRLSIRIQSPERLATDMERWTTTLEVNDGFKHVRELVARGSIYNDWERQLRKQDPGPKSARSGSFDYEQAWLPLARFVERTSGLKDLFYWGSTPFPICLLRVLPQDTCSLCRLHLGNFCLRSLKEKVLKDIAEPLELSPSDLALVTSPNLYAIAALGSAFSAGGSDYKFDAIADIVARACPAVKEVHIKQLRNKGAPRARLRKPYRGLKLNREASQAIRDVGAKAELTSLSLGHSRTLQEWQQRTNFDVLQTLKLMGEVKAGILDWAARSARFPSLSTLHVSNPIGGQSSTTAFLESLPSLKDLTIVKAVNESMISAIVKNHAATLERLSLPDLLFAADTISKAMDGFPCLKHLDIKVRRTEGDFTEVALYTELGAHPQLRTLCLKLDCTIDLTSYTYTQEDIRRSLVNCAIDSTLAAEIFLAIAKAKTPGPPHIRSVELNVVNAGHTPYNHISSIMQPFYLYQHFTRRWKCSFDPRDDRPGKVLAEECGGVEARKFREDSWAELLKLGDMEAAFRALWPEGATGDWRDDWKSFPLHAWWYGGSHWMPAS
jgi:hypothetical protein